MKKKKRDKLKSEKKLEGKQEVESKNGRGEKEKKRVLAWLLKPGPLWPSPSLYGSISLLGLGSR